MATALNPAPSKPPVRYRLRFLVEHEPWLKTFLRNFTDLFRRPLPPLPVTSQPGTYWADAWVERPIAWMSMGRSFFVHVLAIAALYALGLFWPEQAKVVKLSTRTISDFQITPYLPAVNTKPQKKTAPVREHAQKAEPTYAPQEIISIQPNHNSTQQTIIQPTLKLLNQDIPLPNMVIWTPIPSPAPVAPRTTMSQYVPSGAPQVVPPASQTARRSLNNLQFGERPQVVAPPSPIAANHRLLVPEGNVAVIPPAADPVKRPLNNLDSTSGGALSGSASAVAPPSPAAQRDVRGLPAFGQGQQQAIAPAAPVASGTGKTQGQQMGQLLALSANPSAPNGPVTVPEGNRRGEFAAGPDGRPGASGKPEYKQGTNAPAGGPGSGGPTGVYVSAPPFTGTNAGTTGNVAVTAPAAPKPATSRADSPTSKDRNNTGRDTKNGRVEENVFSGRKYYSMMLSMPNLNSGGGSWTIRFAELNPDVLHHSEESLSGPVAISKVDPGYPLELISERVEGTVVLYAVIHSDGSVGEVRVLEGVEMQLDENAMAALKRWKFRPGNKGGVPVDVEAVIHIPFRVPRNAPRNAY
jgi:TonB family protein